jgi:cysteine-rich repeat protein
MPSSLLLYRSIIGALCGALIGCALILPTHLRAASELIVSTTTLTISICGDMIVNAGEECDVPGETGVYSTSIAGRQCTAQCRFGPYCGDAILQTSFDEECDDGNNDSGDFCAADCTIENAGGGGGGSSGGGGGSSGGDDDELGDTQVSITGKAYPNTTVNILEDGDVIGTVRANASADFTFSTDVEPGTTSFGFWAADSRGVRSITLNTTFDVTQGAITNISGILLPPTISIDSATVAKGSTATFSGRSAPNVALGLYIDGNSKTQTAQTASNGDWSIALPTATMREGDHTAKARFEISQGGRITESNFSKVLSFDVGEGSSGGSAGSSDLNGDGKVNLIDFSVLIFWWGTSGGDAGADISGNGRVGIEDFSILLFNWTG